MGKYDEKIQKLLQQMTLEEKAGLLSGSDFWHTKDVERLGIKKMMVTDGPHGLRKQAGDADHLGLNKSVPATCFPTAAATACSFDTELLTEMGQALGEECQQEDVAVLLGPGANIKRNPLCGRNFEYFSEDPYLTGEMASALIKGIQSQDVGTSMKHFACNNQETKRLVIDAEVDERALREIYLTGFEKAVKQAKPKTLMCSYNQINGEPASQNKRLLSDILRDEWGFEGTVMTDWGAIVDRVKGLEAGIDLEMPYVGSENDKAIISAVKEGIISEEQVNISAGRILELLLGWQEKQKKDDNYDKAVHHELARKAAANSCVLLKNDENILPLKKDTKLALIGEFAKRPRYQGAGSSRINPNQLDNLFDVLLSRGAHFTYADGYDLNRDEADEEKIKKAVAAAKDANVAVLCIGLPDSYESEGFDRKHMHLPQSHIKLVEEVAKVNPNIVVLLSGGSVVEMPWVTDAKAVLMLYLAGEAGALAAADLLFGDVCPSGRLAESFPMKLEDCSSYENFPGDEKTVEYRESIYVGYRWYDKAGLDVRFPFGHGLSYTEFEYRDLKTDIQSDGTVTARVTVRNVGKVRGAEVVQFYVGEKNPQIPRPVRELKGFCKADLAPCEEKEVSVILDKRAFAYYDVDKKNWAVPAGRYHIQAGSSSRDIRLESVIELEGDMNANSSMAAGIPKAYINPEAPFNIGHDDFEKLCVRKLPPPVRMPGERYTMNSTFAEIAQTQAGRAFMEQITSQIKSMGEGNDDDGMETMLQNMLQEMPVRSLAMFGQEQLSQDVIQKVLAAANEELIIEL